MNSRTNLFASLPNSIPEEVFETLAQNRSVRIERIVSRGHTSPPGQWYDQDTDEWVLLLQGAARLRLEGHNEFVSLSPGDAILLPARLRHRVEWTDPDQTTIWLAVHYLPDDPVSASHTAPGNEPPPRPGSCS